MNLYFLFVCRTVRVCVGVFALPGSGHVVTVRDTVIRRWPLEVDWTIERAVSKVCVAAYAAVCACVRDRACVSVSVSVEVFLGVPKSSLSISVVRLALRVESWCHRTSFSGSIARRSMSPSCPKVLIRLLLAQMLSAVALPDMILENRRRPR